LFYFAIPPSIYAEVALAVNPHAMSSTGMHSWHLSVEVRSSF
jgi:hypothetical protein